MLIQEERLIIALYLEGCEVLIPTRDNSDWRCRYCGEFSPPGSQIVTNHNRFCKWPEIARIYKEIEDSGRLCLT